LNASFLTISFGDLHVYKNHADQVHEQLKRDIKDPPQLIINPEKKDIFSFTADDFKIEGYDPHPAIKAPVAV
jgi:thymidylate synthase